MKIFEEVVLKDTIKVNAPPEAVFRFLTGMIDTNSYKKWHPKDHISLEWISGEPWQTGSIVKAQELLHGKPHTLKFTVTRIIPDRLIEYAPSNRLMRFYFPRNQFLIEPDDKGSIFTATGVLKVGRIGKLLAKTKLEKGLASVKQHMKEEGENLKELLENR